MLEHKSIDEATAEITDAYDSLIQEAAQKPLKVWRNHNNKLYLIFRSIGKGFVTIVDVVLALRNRFNPLYCDDTDLKSTALLVGTDYKKGSGSIVCITIRNKGSIGQETFFAGTYSYLSSTGMVFSFQVPNDVLFNAQEEHTISAISSEKGGFLVSENADIKLYRSDGKAINSSFVFSCESNEGRLGYPDEDNFTFRQRILNDSDRQDHIKELELKIGNLPNIFECNLKINEDVQPVEYDGITLAPRELLITITGVPTDDIARLVVEEVLYATHRFPEHPENVVYYENPLYIGGKYPVYFKYHDTADFSLEIVYQYDQTVLKDAQVEKAISNLLVQYRSAVRHVDVISENDIYQILNRLALPKVIIMDVNVIAGGVQVPYLTIPITRLPHLTGIAFTAKESGS